MRECERSAICNRLGVVMNRLMRIELGQSREEGIQISIHIMLSIYYQLIVVSKVSKFKF